MSIIKSFSVGHGDMFYIDHNSDNFSIIDCNVNSDTVGAIVEEMSIVSAKKGVSRFICTHPDQDHFGGIELLDDALPIWNFYVVKNSATKDTETVSFQRYCALRDGPKAFYISKGCTRKWMNQTDNERSSSGITVLWPDLGNENFKEALAKCDAGESFNNTSAVLRYSLQDGGSAMWLGDLEAGFMEEIINDITLEKTTIVFASHHGRQSGKIPDSWLEKLDPQIIVIGEAPSRHLHYYTGYQTITQNRAWDLTMDFVGDKVHFYSGNPDYNPTASLSDEGENKFDGYFGSITVETEFTLDATSPQAR
jgi:beta-lactamase superfamily II metal-dependent hydrolase